LAGGGKDRQLALDKAVDVEIDIVRLDVEALQLGLVLEHFQGGAKIARGHVLGVQVVPLGNVAGYQLVAAGFQRAGEQRAGCRDVAAELLVRDVPRFLAGCRVRGGRKFAYIPKLRTG